jgi:hypothetical protein
VEVHKFTEKDHKQWEDFVAGANNGTIFHTLKFLSYHPPERFKNHNLLIKDKDNIVALFPAVMETTEKDKVIVSHRGASYGGFVLRPGLGVHEIHLAVENLVAALKKEGIKKIILTQTPLIYYQEPNQYVDFVLMKHGFRYRKREITAVIPLDAAEPLLTFHADARRSTKKAIREGVQACISNDYPAYYNILKHNLGMRHNAEPTHTLAELHKIKQLFPEDILLFGACLNGRMIGGMVIFVANPNVILAFYISHDNEYQAYRPVNLLFYEVIKWGRDRGFKYLDLGTFTLNMEPNWGLGRFKENHNARGFLRDTYELNL